MYGRYALPVTPPARSGCDVCAGPAEFAQVADETTLGVWCGPECAIGRRAGDLRVGEQVAVWAAQFPEVRSWAERRGGHRGDMLIFRGFAHLAVVASVTDAGVTLINPGQEKLDLGRDEPRRGKEPDQPSTDDQPESLLVPANFPCTRVTGITARPKNRRPGGRIVWRWPVDGPWVRDVTFGHWVSYQPQGSCEDSPDCDAPAILWVSYRQGRPNSTDAPSCERCLARRLRRRAQEHVRATTSHQDPWPAPVAFWDPTLRAWDVRPHDGSATQLA